MEFDFNVNSVLKADIVKFNAQLLASSRRSHSAASKESMEHLATVINHMGEASAKAQELHQTITTFNKLLESDHVLYVMKDNVNNEKCVVVGILKMGKKKLFLEDESQRLHEIIPLCVLDFYIHESYQRKGCGLKLFKFMLKDQNAEVHDLAVDRPSAKLLSFMKKHYSYLGEPILQRNNFTVYKQIFSDATLCSNDYKLYDVLNRRSKGLDEIPVVTNNDCTKSHVNKTSKRFSCPNYLSIDSSSVASVVFGQRFSQNLDDENKERNIDFMRPRMVDSSSSCSMDVDSSMNIFGIPSPSNRHHLS